MDRIYTDAIYAKMDSGFNASEAAEDIIDPLDNLCQLMFDPENQPPQLSREQAWEKYLEIRAAAETKASIQRGLDQAARKDLGPFGVNHCYSDACGGCKSPDTCVCFCHTDSTRSGDKA